jgi:hypothetical protein
MLLSETFVLFVVNYLLLLGVLCDLARDIPIGCGSVTLGTISALASLPALSRWVSLVISQRAFRRRYSPVS